MWSVVITANIWQQPPRPLEMRQAELIGEGEHPCDATVYV